MEDVFEIKLFLKTEDDNVHIGSFMIDLNILLSERCKASNDLFLTVKNLKITFYDISQKKSDNSLILVSKLSLIRSDLRLNEYDSMSNYFLDLFKNKRNQFLTEIENTKSDPKEYRQVLTKLLTENYYDEIDSNIMPLDVDENMIPDAKTTNIDILINVFSNEDSFSNYQEYSLLKLKALEKNYLDRNQKLKIRNNEKLFYKLSKKKLLELLNLEGDSKEFVKEAISFFYKENTSYIDFEIIKVEYAVESEAEKNNINLLEYVYFTHCMLSDKNKLVSQDKNVLIPTLTSKDKDKGFLAFSTANYNSAENRNICDCSNYSLHITVISAMRLTFNKHNSMLHFHLFY